MSGRTASKTFDLMSVNACDRKVLLAAFYLRQHDGAEEVLPCRVVHSACMQLLLIHWKTAHMDFMYSSYRLSSQR